MNDKRAKRCEANCFDEKQIVAEEDLIIDAQFLIQEALDERGITRSELAQCTGISKARLSQLMRAEANPTLRTLAKLFYALDDQLCLSRKRGSAQACESNETWALGTQSVRRVIPSEVKHASDYRSQLSSSLSRLTDDSEIR